MKNTEKSTEKNQNVKEEVKEIKTVDAHLRAEKKAGFYAVSYTDKVKPENGTQNLKACVMESGLVVFGNRNFSTTADHALIIGEEIKPFSVKIRRSNMRRHEKIHGASSPVLKAITDGKIEIIED